LQKSHRLCYLNEPDLQMNFAGYVKRFGVGPENLYTLIYINMMVDRCKFL